MDKRLVEIEFRLPDSYVHPDDEGERPTATD